jgi:hypothetical protein
MGIYEKSEVRNGNGLAQNVAFADAGMPRAAGRHAHQII